MDKFEESIKNANQPQQPSGNFVDTTMDQVNQLKPKRRWGIKVWAPALVGTVAVLAIIFVALPGDKSNTDSKTTSPASSTQPAKQLANNSATTPTAGSDNTSLQNDLNGVQSSMNQESNDQGTANSAINDNQQEITVPTD